MALRIKRADTTDELDGLFRVRHEVFVEEKSYSQPTSDRRLVDRFDAFPSTANVIALDGDTVVGGVRFMSVPASGGPHSPYYDFAPHLPPGARVGNGSMLVMKPQFRTVRGATFTMLGMGYQWALAQKMTHVVGLAAPEAEPLFLKMGYEAVAARIPFDGAGETALPVMLDVERLADPFREFARRHSAEFLLESPVRQFSPAGETVVERGAKDDAVFVIVSGKATVRGANGREVDRLGPGDLFGEIALLAELPRTADVVAETDLELVVVDRERFYASITNRPEIAISLLRIIALRLGRTGLTDSSGR